MEFVGTLKDKKLTSVINLPDGVYEIKIKEKDKSRSYEQIKKCWACIDEISKHEYGDTSQSENIYFQILDMAGVKTEKIILPVSAIEPFRKKVRTLRVISQEVINHVPMAIVNVCMKGLSEMSKQEASQIIETIIKYANEIGINAELESWK